MKVFLAILPIVVLLCCANCNSLTRWMKNSCRDAIPGNQTIYPNVNLTSNFTVNFTTNSFISVARLKNNQLGVTVYSKGPENVNLTVRGTNGTHSMCINVQQCPLGFHNVDGECVCIRKSEFNHAVSCNNETFKLRVFSGYCVDNTTMVGKKNVSELIAVRCPFSYDATSAYSPLGPNTSAFCDIFHRQGHLCGECKRNYGIAVYADTFQCVSCQFKVKYVFKYIAIEIIPVTLLLLLILYFHVTITSGPANAYIFFAQTVTLPFEVTFHKFALTVLFTPLHESFLPKGLVQSVIIPYSFWNLDFHRIMGSSDFCLSENLRALDILALKYASMLYPVLFLFVCYIVIELQGMNFRPVIWMLKILCFPCMRWRRVWKAKNSILDTIATYVLLSYYKVIYVSILLLSNWKVDGLYSSSKKVLVFDPSTEAYSEKHLPFFFTAIIVLLTFGVFPPILLFLYQFKTCYSFLERLRLNRPGMVQFVQAFQGCYKDGSNGTGDRRFFAGLYFVFRIMLVTTIIVNKDISGTFGILSIFCFSFAIICAILQPYKKTKYTVLDSFFFFILGMIFGLQAYVYVILMIEQKELRDILVNQFLLYLPLLYMTFYVARWVFMFLKNRDPSRYLLLNDSELKDDPAENREEENRQPIHIDISPRPTITQTEVSIAELSQENTSSESSGEEGERALLLGKKREMKIFSQHAATLSAEYRIARDT